MLKQFGLFIFWLVFLIACKSQNSTKKQLPKRTTDLHLLVDLKNSKDHRLKGKVKSDKIYFYNEIENGSISPSAIDTLTTLRHYDSNGFEIHSYDRSNQITLNRIITQTTNGYSIITSMSSRRDSTEQTIYLDESKRVLEMFFTVQGDENIVKRTFTYDDQLNQVEEWQYYSNGTKEKAIRMYDENEVLISENQSNKEPRLVEEKIYKYGSNGNLLSTEVFRGGRCIYVTNFKYNEQNLKVEEITTNKSGDEKYSEDYFVYNSQGELIQYDTKRSGPEFQVLKYSYVYDEKNNWVKKYNYSNGKLLTILIREIEYFD